MRLAILLIAIISFSSQLFAGYANPRPPTGYTPNPAGGGYYKSNRSAQRDAANNNWYTDAASVYLPGAGDIKYPVSMKEAANAANYLAKRSFLPSLLGQAALSAMANWLADAGLTTWIDPSTGEQRWAKPDENADTNKDGFEYSTSYQPTWTSSANDVCAKSATSFFASWVILVSSNAVGNTCQYTYKAPGNNTVYTASLPLNKRPHPCPLGWISTPAGCILPSMRPVTLPEFEEIVSPRKIPVELPPILPFGLPVEDPKTNPKPFPFGDPDPFFVPTGDPYPAPQPRPDPDPYPWREPGIDVQPAPKPAPDPNPWRLEPRPVVKPLPDPNPTPNPNPFPVPNPNPPINPNPSPQPPLEPKETPLLCEVFPDILACATLGDIPNSEELPNKDVDVAINPLSFGSSNAACPQPKTATLALVGQVSYSFDSLCQYAGALRPLVVALAWFSAALLLVGASRKS